MNGHESIFEYDTLEGARRLCAHIVDLLGRQGEHLEVIQMLQEHLFVPPVKIDSLLYALRDFGVVEEVCFYGYAEFKYFAHVPGRTLLKPHSRRDVRLLCEYLEDCLSSAFRSATSKHPLLRYPENRDHLMERLSELYSLAGGRY